MHIRENTTNKQQKKNLVAFTPNVLLFRELLWLNSSIKTLSVLPPNRCFIPSICCFSYPQSVALNVQICTLFYYKAIFFLMTLKVLL